MNNIFNDDFQDFLKAFNKNFGGEMFFCKRITL